jgi:hypothetical protein
MVLAMSCIRKGRLVLWRWQAKRAEPFGFALIFFVSFLYQDKKENKG